MRKIYTVKRLKVKQDGKGIKHSKISLNKVELGTLKIKKGKIFKFKESFKKSRIHVSFRIRIRLEI